MARLLAMALAGLLLLVGGCASYQPRAHLAPAAEAFPLTLYVMPFQDLTPPEDDAGGEDLRLSLTEDIKTEGPLADYLRRAVMVEFTSSQLFRSLAVDQGRADVTIIGVIRQFSAATRHRPWVRFPGGRFLARHFSAGQEGWEGAIDLELTLSDRHGRRLGTYRGQREYMEPAEGHARAGTPSLSPAERRFDDAFTDTLRDLRDQILRDRARILAAVRTTGNAHPAGPTGSPPPGAP